MVAPLPPVQARLARGYSGLAVRYAAPAPASPASVGTPHPLAGARLPRGRLTGTDGSTARLYELFHEGRFVLLEADGAEGITEAGDGLPGQVRRVRYAHCDGTRLPAAALVRPDGYLAWASDDRDARSRARAARAAVRWWCGPA